MVKTLDPDIAMLVLPGTDTICHLAFHLHDATHPAHVSDGTSPLVDIYRHVDSEVGQLVDDLTPEDEHVTVLVISDDGIRKRYDMVNVNLWLERAGYLFFVDKEISHLGDKADSPRPGGSVSAELQRDSTDEQREDGAVARST